MAALFRANCSWFALVIRKPAVNVPVSSYLTAPLATVDVMAMGLADVSTMTVLAPSENVRRFVAEAVVVSPDALTAIAVPVPVSVIV